MSPDNRRVTGDEDLDAFIEKANNKPPLTPEEIDQILALDSAGLDDLARQVREEDR